MNVHGSCHCGSVAFEALVDPAQVLICHCNACQILTGTAYRVTVPAAASGFRLLRGEPRIYVKVADSRAGVACVATRSRPSSRASGGEADAWTPDAPCKPLAAAATARGESVTHVSYAGAHHGFDAPNTPVHLRTGLPSAPEGRALTSAPIRRPAPMPWRACRHSRASTSAPSAKSIAGATGDLRSAARPVAWCFELATYEARSRYAVGMHHVLVSGVPVLADGEHAGALPGRALRGRSAAFR